MLSLSKQIPVESLLCKTTTCRMQPVTTFFVSQMKKGLSNTTTKDFIQQRNVKQTYRAMYKK